MSQNHNDNEEINDFQEMDESYLNNSKESIKAKIKEEDDDNANKSKSRISQDRERHYLIMQQIYEIPKGMDRKSLQEKAHQNFLNIMRKRKLYEIKKIKKINQFINRKRQHPIEYSKEKIHMSNKNKRENKDKVNIYRNKINNQNILGTNDFKDELNNNDKYNSINLIINKKQPRVQKRFEKNKEGIINNQKNIKADTNINWERKKTDSNLIMQEYYTYLFEYFVDMNKDEMINFLDKLTNLPRLKRNAIMCFIFKDNDYIYLFLFIKGELPLNLSEKEKYMIIKNMIPKLKENVNWKNLVQYCLNEDNFYINRGKEMFDNELIKYRERHNNNSLEVNKRIYNKGMRCNEIEKIIIKNNSNINKKILYWIITKFTIENAIANLKNIFKEKLFIKNIEKNDWISSYNKQEIICIPLKNNYDRNYVEDYLKKICGDYEIEIVFGNTVFIPVYRCVFIVATFDLYEYFAKNKDIKRYNFTSISLNKLDDIFFLKQEMEKEYDIHL